MTVNLYDHQKEAIEKMHNGCILYGDVGVGKTITSLGYFYQKVCGGEIGVWGSLKKPMDLYVITTAKVRDSGSFVLQAAQYGIHKDPKVSTNGVKIVVDSWNNITKYTDVKNAFFIFDEQRVVGYGAWSKAFIKIARSNRWILLSATPGDTWMDYIPVFIANGWYKHKTDFLDKHVIWTPRVKYPKVLRYQNVNVLVKRRNHILVKMPHKRHTTRHQIDVLCDYDRELLDKAVKRRWHVFEERPMRDASELFLVMRKVVNSSSSRSKAIQELLRKHPKVIVFYNFDYELEILRSLASTWSCGTCGTEMCGESSVGLVDHHFPSSRESSRSTDSTTSTESGCSASLEVAEWNGHKHQEIPKSDRWLYLVQYRAGAEGWNCVETDAMVFWSQTYSYRDWWQAHGRIDRLNTPYDDLYYYHLISDSVIDKAIRRALKAKKNFNERDLAL